MAKIEPRLIHTNKGYGDFLPCPFCGSKPGFSVSFFQWHGDKENYCFEDADEFPAEDPAGFVVHVSCLNCTISMQTPYCPREGAVQHYKLSSKEDLLNSDFYRDKFGDLQWRWNRRQAAFLFPFPVKIEITASGENETHTSESKP